MDSPILRSGARFLVPLMLLFSLFLLVRGHNEPGGGFVNPNGFQIFSAGEDGLPNTDDDIKSW